MKRRRARAAVVPSGLPSDHDLDAVVRNAKSVMREYEAMHTPTNGHAKTPAPAVVPPTPPITPRDHLTGETLPEVLDCAFMRLLRSLDGDITVKVGDHVKALEAASKWAVGKHAIDHGQGWGGKLGEGELTP